jgi:antitoxin component of MazEF toxin-antitoxin module
MLTVEKKLYDQGGSLIVILPKIWTEAKRLKPHDRVLLVLNDELKIRPAKEGEN